MTTLRARLERWFGRPRFHPLKDPATTTADIQREGLTTRYNLAQERAKFVWKMHRVDQRDEPFLRRLERRSGKPVVPPISEETALVRQITARNRSRRDGAAAALHGRNLTSDAALTLVWQLRHRNPAYREAAKDALWQSTITDESAVLVLAGQLKHRKPELREVARQVLQDTKINITDDRVTEYLESARRWNLDSSHN